MEILMELTTDDINSDGEVSVFVVVEQILMVANPDVIYELCNY